MSDEYALSGPNIIQTEYGPVDSETDTCVKQITSSKVNEPGGSNAFSSDRPEYDITKGKMVDTDKNKAIRAQNYPGANYEQLSSLSPGMSLPIQQKPNLHSASFFELLSKYGRSNKLEDTHFSNLSSKVTSSSQKRSTEDIMRVAAERFIQFPTKDLDRITTFIHPYGSALSSLSKEETRGADLVYLLLAAADEVCNSKFDSARRLLARCQCMASKSGNPIERLVSYFSEALQERISRETGNRRIKIVSENLRISNGLAIGVDHTVMAIHEKVPFSKVMHFASTQTISEHVATKANIHLIDLHIRSGIQWTPMIQALSERKAHPVQLLKITALGTNDKNKLEDIGKRLKCFANSLNIPFIFNSVIVHEMSYLSKELFDIESDEAVVIYAPSVLRTMISRPDTLETLMRVIGELKPLIMILQEVDSNDNSPSFINRFVEALFFYSAWFDCLEDCLERDNQHRNCLERMYFGKGIINTIATEGEERITRSVKIDVWRSYFARFQMVEVELLASSLHQAGMVLEQEFACSSSCTLNNDGKCLIIGWKGTPMFSLSTWKFEETP